LRRVTNGILLALALVAVALGAAVQAGLLHAPAPALAFFVIAAIFAGLLGLRLLPLRVRRPIVFLLALVILVGLTGGLAYFQFVMKPAMVKGFLSAAFAPKPTAVAVETAKTEQWPPRLTAIGTLRAFQGVAIAPQVPGVVTTIHFESGDNVEAGALLVNIDDSIEQADLVSGLAQLKNTDVTLERQKQLSSSGNTPQSSVDSAVAARDVAAAAVTRTRAVIAQKAIRAPFAGRLGLRNVDAGQYVAVGTSLVTLQRLDPIYADFPTPEDALATLAIGQPVTMNVAALPGRDFTGRVTAIDARVSAESRNVLVRAQFDNPDRKLLPGMFANLTVTTGGSAEVTTLSRTAIVYSLYGDNVFVVKPAVAPASGLTVERRFVKLGATRGERVAVSEGVKAGEQIVSAGQIKLQANGPVTIDENGALPLPPKTPKP